MGNATRLHQLQGRLWAKAPVVGHDGAAKVQRGQECVQQATSPGPVGWAPKDGLCSRLCKRVKSKPVLARHKARQVADQRAVCQQRALGVAGGATGVDQDGGLIGTRLHWGELRAELRQCVGKFAVGLLQHGFGVAHTNDGTQLRAMFAGQLQVGQSRQICNGQHGLAVLQAVFQRVGPKQQRQGHGHRTHLQHSHIGHRSLKPLGHDDSHAIAALHALRGQDIG